MRKIIDLKGLHIEINIMFCKNTETHFSFYKINFREELLIEFYISDYAVLNKRTMLFINECYKYINKNKPKNSIYVRIYHNY